MFFTTERSLNLHLKYNCLKGTDALCPISEIKESPKKIGIQIRKVYKTSDGSVVVSSGGPSDSPVKVIETSLNSSPNIAKVRYLDSRGPLSIDEVNADISKYINYAKARCKACSANWSSKSSLKRHSALHVCWTRFECRFCGLRHYNSYTLQDHIINNHQVHPTDVGQYCDQVNYFNAPFRKNILNCPPPRVVKVNSNDDTSDDGFKNVESNDSEEIVLAGPSDRDSAYTESSDIDSDVIMNSPQKLTLKLKRIRVNEKTKTFDSIIKKLDIKEEISEELQSEEKFSNACEVINDSVQQRDVSENDPSCLIKSVVEELKSSAQSRLSEKISLLKSAAEKRAKELESPEDLISQQDSSQEVKDRNTSVKRTLDPEIDNETKKKLKFSSPLTNGKSSQNTLLTPIQFKLAMTELLLKDALEESSSTEKNTSSS